ncbi:hypothetical protein V6N13_025399 [Hibiscus sabdariffa]
MIRKVRNRITSLKISDGSWCDDEEILKDEAVAYYKSLFSLDQPAANAATYYSMFSGIGSNFLSHLDPVPSPDKIRAALMDMDIWVPDVGRLCDQVMDPTVPFHYPIFSALMTPSGSWNLSLLSSIFPASVAHRILSIRCPVPDGGSDFCRWRWDDRLTISSAYAKCVEHTLSPHSNSWNVARNIWSAVFGRLLSARFYADNLDIWLLSNLRCSMPTHFSNIPWPILFASTCWHIWKSRSDSIFFGIDAPIDNTTSRVISWLRQYSFVSSAAHAQQPVRDATTSSWSAPSSPWVCLNTYGSTCLRSSYARAGDVICDCNGAWLAGFGRGIGIADAFTTELWAIYDGLSLDWQLGFEFVHVQSDCLKAISELSDTNASHSYPVLLREILSLCQRSWTIEFLWVPRAANTVADHLLK